MSRHIMNSVTVCTNMNVSFGSTSPVLRSMLTCATLRPNFALLQNHQSEGGGTASRTDTIYFVLVVVVDVVVVPRGLRTAKGKIKG